MNRDTAYSQNPQGFRLLGSNSSRFIKYSETRISWSGTILKVKPLELLILRTNECNLQGLFFYFIFILFLLSFMTCNIKVVVLVINETG